MDNAPPPVRFTLEQIKAEREDIHRAVPPPSGETIPISVTPFPINDSVPREEEFEGAARRLRGHQLRGPSWMRAEHLREWLLEHKAEEAMKEKLKEAEAEGETLGSEERESEPEEGTADRGQERDLKKWEKVVEIFQLAL